MKTPLIKIGNSRGIRLPQSVIEQCGLEDTACEMGKLARRAATITSDHPGGLVQAGDALTTDEFAAIRPRGRYA